MYVCNCDEVKVCIVVAVQMVNWEWASQDIRLP